MHVHTYINKQTNKLMKKIKNPIADRILSLKTHVYLVPHNMALFGNKIWGDAVS